MSSNRTKTATAANVYAVVAEVAVAEAPQPNTRAITGTPDTTTTSMVNSCPIDSIGHKPFVGTPMTFEAGTPIDYIIDMIGTRRAFARKNEESAPGMYDGKIEKTTTIIYTGKPRAYALMPAGGAGFLRVNDYEVISQ